MITAGFTTSAAGGAGTPAGGPGGISLTSVTDGHLMVLWVAVNSATIPAVPAGWTDRGSAAGTANSYRVLTRIKQPGDTAVLVGGTPAVVTQAELAAFGGADWGATSAPVSVAGPAMAVTPASLSGFDTTAWSLLLVGAAPGGSSVTFTWPAGWSNAVQATNFVAAGIAKRATPGPGPVTPGAVTMNVNCIDIVAYQLDIIATGPVALVPHASGVSTAAVTAGTTDNGLTPQTGGVSTAEITDLVIGPLPLWRANYQKFIRGEGRATAVGIGDSLMEGFWAGPNAHALDMWTTRCGLDLAQRGGAGNASRYMPTEGQEGSGTDHGPWAEANPPSLVSSDPWTRTGTTTVRTGSGGIGERSTELSPQATIAIPAPSWATRAQVHYRFTAAAINTLAEMEVRSNGVLVGRAFGSSTEQRQLEVVLNGVGRTLLISNPGTGTTIQVDGVTWQARSRVPGVALAGSAATSASAGVAATFDISGAAVGTLLVLWAAVTSPVAPAAPAVPAGWTDRGSAAVGTSAYRLCSRVKQPGDTSVSFGGGGTNVTEGIISRFGNAEWGQSSAPVSAATASAITPPPLDLRDINSYSLLFVGSRLTGTIFNVPQRWGAYDSGNAATSVAAASRTGVQGHVVPAAINLSQGPQDCAVIHAEIRSTLAAPAAVDPYVEVIEGGHGGYSAASYTFGSGTAQHGGAPLVPSGRLLATNDMSNRWASAVALLEPHLAIIWMGVNDAQAADTPGDFTHNLAAIVTALDAATAPHPPDLLFVGFWYVDLSGPPPGGTVYSSAAWDGLANAMSALAGTYGNRAQFLDFRSLPAWQRYLPYPGTDANPYPDPPNPVVSGDHVHPNALGHNILGDIMAGVLGQLTGEVPLVLATGGTSTAAMTMTTGQAGGPVPIAPHADGAGAASLTLSVPGNAAFLNPTAHGTSSASLRIHTGHGGVIPSEPGGPCAWPIDAACCSLADNADPDTLALLTAAASEILWAGSGRQFGQCSITVRPCRRTCANVPLGQTWWEFGSTYPSYPQPVLFDGAWFNLTCGTCGDSCSCHSVEEVVLPGAVTAIVDVTIDGVVLNPSAYRVDNGRLLVRQDGGLWPLCNDLSKPPGQHGTWTVTALYGKPVPSSGRIALGELVCELIKACTDDPSCRLPERLQTLTRQGVTQNFLDARTLIAPGEHGLVTGLRLVNYFLETYNPYNLAQRSEVFNLDLPQPRTVG